MFSGLLQNNRSMISIHAPPLNKIDGHNLSIRMAQLPLILKMALGNTKKLMESTTWLSLTTEVPFSQNSVGRVYLVLGTAQMTAK